MPNNVVFNSQKTFKDSALYKNVVHLFTALSQDITVSDLVLALVFTQLSNKQAQRTCW